MNPDEPREGQPHAPDAHDEPPTTPPASDPVHVAQPEPPPQPPPAPSQPAPAQQPPTAQYYAPAPAPPRIKSPWFAALLSLFPGMGNVYNGLYLRAVTFFAAVVAAIYLADRGSDLWGFAVAFVWIFNIIDAFRQATLINHGYAEEPGLALEKRGRTAAREKLFAGVALLALGVLELIDRYVPIVIDRLFDLWPVVFVLIGGWLIWKAIQAKREGEAAV